MWVAIICKFPLLHSFWPPQYVKISFVNALLWKVCGYLSLHTWIALCPFLSLKFKFQCCMGTYSIVSKLRYVFSLHQITLMMVIVLRSAYVGI